MLSMFQRPSTCNKSLASTSWVAPPISGSLPQWYSAKSTFVLYMPPEAVFFAPQARFFRATALGHEFFYTRASSQLRFVMNKLCTMMSQGATYGAPADMATIVSRAEQTSHNHCKDHRVTLEPHNISYRLANISLCLGSPKNCGFLRSGSSVGDGAGAVATAMARCGRFAAAVVTTTGFFRALTASNVTGSGKRTIALTFNMKSSLGNTTYARWLICTT